MSLITDKIRLSGRTILLLLLIGMATVLLVEYDHWRHGPVSSRLNHFLYDSLSKNIKDTDVSGSIVIVDIDETSLWQMGQWPWPRYRLGHLIEAIAQMQPAVIGLDVLMPEPDRTSLQTVQKDLWQDFNLQLDFSTVPPEFLDNDLYLATILQRTPIVTAHYFLFDHSTPESYCSLKTVQVKGASADIHFFEAPGLLCNTERLTLENGISGFINTLDDEDGILRKMPVFIRYGGELSPSLALAAVMKYLSVDEIELERDVLGIVARIGDYRLPIQRDGGVLLRYPGPAGMYPYISAFDILQGKITPDSIRGKIVLIGSSAAGLHDFHHTLHDPNYPGVETVAVAAGNILGNVFVRQPFWSLELSLLLSGATAVLVGLLFVYAGKPEQVVTGVVMLLALLLGGAALAFALFRVFLPVSAPVVVACLLFSIFSVIRYGVEQRAVLQSYRKMARSQQVTLESMAMVVETRDYETGGHIKRTQHFVRILAEGLAAGDRHRKILTPDYIQLLFISAPLHDIGKVGVPDHILLKPGPLDFDEFEEMKKHCEYGRRILLESGRKLGGDNYLELACEIAESHHERWDGSGYPRGLAGEEIPLSGRIMMVADVYDALVSRRCYKPAFSHKKAREILLAGMGTSFDPNVIEAFFSREQEIIAIGETIKDMPD